MGKKLGLIFHPKSKNGSFKISNEKRSKKNLVQRRERKRTKF